MAPRILIFSIAMDADYSFELDFIETKHPIFGHDNLFLGWVLQFAFKGTEAIDRSDVYYTISDLDHPVSALLQSPFEINKGMSALIGITKKEVNIILCNLKQLI